MCFLNEAYHEGVLMKTGNLLPEKFMAREEKKYYERKIYRVMKIIREKKVL